jgi:hypothetical protein
VLDVPLFWEADIRAQRLDVLILVNGAFAFCAHLPDLAVAIRRAGRIIWIQNDYAIYPPINSGQAESPFRKAFRIRKAKGLPDMDLWTTVKDNAKSTPSSRYMNWNLLTARRSPLPFRSDASTDLFYYGAFRVSRARSFDRYFAKHRIDLSISSASKKFAARYPHATCQTTMAKGSFYTELNAHGLGLYIEDPRSHAHFHSPANRFYEMLSAGLPMVFEPEAAPMLRRAGYIIDDFVVTNQRDVQRAFRHRKLIHDAQHNLWWSDFRNQLVTRVATTYHRYCSTHFPP